MKKFAVLMIACALALSSFAACGGNEGDTQSKNESEASKVISTEDSKAPLNLSALSADLKTKLVATETLDKSSEDLFNDTGIADSTYENYFWFSEMSGLSSETVALFEAKTEADVATIKGFLDGYVQSVKNQMKDYNADNYDMATKAVIKTSGLYVYMVISPNVDTIDGAIASALA
ncbi:MAG: DUF4358 domain-containing protein [Clostridia bacterium]|nr:DUF4358 domain-containing protein [Clostridia bacterium]